MRVCLYSPWQAASSCWTWHLSRCYQVAEAITPLPGPPGHTVYLSRLGRHQWLGCWLEFALSLLHTVFNLCRCREYMQGCGPAFHSTLISKYCKRCGAFLAEDNYKKKWSTSSYSYPIYYLALYSIYLFISIHQRFCYVCKHAITVNERFCAAWVYLSVRARGREISHCLLAFVPVISSLAVILHNRS